MPFRRLPMIPISLQQRAFATSKYAMLEAKDVSISEGHDLEIVVKDATRLVDGGRWHLCNQGRGLERHFKFRTFKATWDFMNTVSAECKKQKHHPEWTNIYNKTHVRWTTHNPLGLSSKDTRMAEFCDRAALEQCELPAQNESADAKVTGNGRMEAGDCCGLSK